MLSDDDIDLIKRIQKGCHPSSSENLHEVCLFLWGLFLFLFTFGSMVCHVFYFNKTSLVAVILHALQT